MNAAIVLLWLTWAEKHTSIQFQHNQCHGLFAVYFTAIMFDLRCLCSHKSQFPDTIAGERAE